MGEGGGEEGQGGGGTSNYSDPHHEDEKGAVNFHTPHCAAFVPGS
jgi:hypothetical protein